MFILKSTDLIALYRYELNNVSEFLNPHLRYSLRDVCAQTNLCVKNMQSIKSV
jgi:hypothetical protein